MVTTKRKQKRMNAALIKWGIIGIVVLGILMSIGSFISTANSEASIRAAIEAKQKDNVSQLDNMAKKISQVAQVSQEQMKALKEIIIGYAESRSGKDNPAPIMNWIKETVPNIDTKTFSNLQNIIVSSRDSFTMKQSELLDLKREHDLYFMQFPANIVMKILGRQRIDVTIVTSTRAQEAFKTGVDNDTDVFKK